MATFEYQELDTSGPNFGLVRLIQGKSEMVHCELFHASFEDLEDIITYEALSYTWGDLELSSTVELNGCLMGVTWNLWTALQHLRMTDRDRVLWVDALCIDQTNLAERGHQVAQMGDIYRRADRVIIWLGLASYGTDELMESYSFSKKNRSRPTCVYRQSMQMSKVCGTRPSRNCAFAPSYSTKSCWRASRSC
jgi:hypothetical protein